MTIPAATDSRLQLADESGNVQAQVDKNGNLTVTGSVTGQGGTVGGAVTATSVAATGSVTSGTPAPAAGSTVGATVSVRKVNIPSAQLLALKATPQTIIAAPGAGLAIDVLSVSVKQNFLTAGYTLNAGTLKLYQGPPASAIPLTADLSGVLTPGADTDIVGQPVISPGAQTAAASENVAVTLGNTGAAEFTAGAGSLDVVVTYITHNM